MAVLLSLLQWHFQEPKDFVCHSKQVRCCRCLCGRVAYTVSQLQMWWISEIQCIVNMVLQLQKQTRQKGSGAEDESNTFNLNYRFETRFKCCCCETSDITLFRSNMIVSVFISHNSKLPFIHTSPVHTAKHFTSCWCQGRSLYLFLSPQKSSLTPVFIIKLWLLGRHHDSSVIDDWRWLFAEYDCCNLQIHFDCHSQLWVLL